MHPLNAAPVMPQVADVGWPVGTGVVVTQRIFPPGARAAEAFS